MLENNMPETVLIKPGSFSPGQHWYPKALNAQIHPMVLYFLNMSNQRVAERYAYRNPQVDLDVLMDILSYQPQFFRWAGSDLMHATNHRGRDQMVLIETNSCPSGMKSFPLIDENEEHGSYWKLMEEVFLPHIPKKNKGGAIAVLFDKNEMENKAYAATLADLLDEEIYLVDMQDHDYSRVFEKDEYLWIKTNDGEVKLRAAFRYITYKPWKVLPAISKTVMLNPVVCCLAGGRNKLIAAKAYDFLNADLEGSGLQIMTPETIWDVQKNELPLWLERFAYRAVIKVPYSNAGQGVFTISSKKQFDDFMTKEFDYDQFIVQQLIGHPINKKNDDVNVYSQVGTVPNKKSQMFVFDVRLMVGSTKHGFRPMAANSRRAAVPLSLENFGKLMAEETTFHETPEMLMTNLSFIEKDGSWSTDDSRLLMMDQRDFNKLGLALDDLIDGYIQTVLAVVAIDKMAQNLISTKKKLKKRLFQSLNNDAQLHQEIWPE